MASPQVKFPADIDQLDQNEEYFLLSGNGHADEKIYFHDYSRIYKVAGLYEEVFHHQLKCNSPTVIANLLFDTMIKESHDPSNLRVLDYGAGNGLVAEALSAKSPEAIIGVDILPEAKEAAMRDRGALYYDYLVSDLAKAPESELEKLKNFRLNALVTVAALGFNHIAPDSFRRAFNLIANDGWVAFNIRDRFLTQKDDSGFKEAMDFMAQEHINLKAEKTYVHRLSTNGEPIHYTAIVGRKTSDMQR